MVKGITRCLVAAIWVTLLNACGVAPERDRAPVGKVDLSSIPDAVPRVEPKSRYGNPQSYVVNGKQYFTLPSSQGFVTRGIASWYGVKFHGRRTSSGEVYDMYAMTAAHKELPLPTYAAVRNLLTGREIVVRVNDRGPFHQNRILDLSYAAATKLGIARKGTGFIEMRALDPGPAAARPVAGPPWSRSAVIFIQAGAFHAAENAAKLRDSLVGVSRAPIRVLRTSHGGRLLYRVRLGPVSGVEEADRITNALGVLGFERPHIVVE